jgi:hypothetical protein
MEEEEEEVFDNRIFTALDNNPKQEIISVPGTPKDLTYTHDQFILQN